MSDLPQARRMRDWLCRHALPLWAADRHSRDGFAECLAPDGTPDWGAPRRTMVQARQIYVYSHAAILGLMPDGAAISQSGFDFLLRHGAPDGVANGFVHRLDRHGGVLDATRDLYDHAFLLMGFSWYYRAGGGRQAKAAIEQVSKAIEGLRHPSGRGYAENATGTLPRRQNPHMHLLEAFLAAHEATGGEEMLHKAGSIVDLFRNHFFCSGMLCEYFDDNFAPLPSPAFVEPGHHLEWVWLLSHYARAAGQDVTDLIQALYRPAMQFGAEPQSGLIYNRIAGDGAVVDAAKRLWPQTEQVKAQRALGRPGAEAMLDVIFRHFLEPASPGAWADRLDAHNNPLPGTVPASSLYHLFQAFAAIDQTP